MGNWRIYLALEDMEVAAICYKAVMMSKISFDNIYYRMLGKYIAMNLSKEEALIHPLRRVLLVRTGSTGGRPWVTGDFKEAKNMWRDPDRDREKNRSGRIGENWRDVHDEHA